MTQKKPEATILVQARIPADLHAWLVRRAAKEASEAAAKVSVNKTVRKLLETARSFDK